jgi:hypothetical protein
MDFLNYREGGMVFYQVFLLSPLHCTVTELRNCKRLLDFEEIEVNVNSKEENSSDFCLDFVQEFGLYTSVGSAATNGSKQRREFQSEN